MFLLTCAQFNVLRNIYDSGAPTRFADIHDKIHASVQSPDSLGNTADGNVVAWFGAAAQPSRSVGGKSFFIRTYTAAQLEFREADPLIQDSHCRSKPFVAYRGGSQ